MMDFNEGEVVEQEKIIQKDHFSEEDVEFVSEGPSRPVLECIDLLSDDESQILYRHREDHVDHPMKSVTATLDRLARDVEAQKRKQAEKNKAFQDKLNSQRAHGLQELALNKDRPGASAAKVCVNQWLKMPGLRPGNVSSSRRTFSQPREIGPLNTEPITCPVMHCNRKFDNRQLLFGHLKRFDHSPCDPTISLRGVSDSSYACLVCQQRFVTTEEYNAHLATKIKLADGHQQTLPPLVIQCFACPRCFLLFNQRDECLKHMSANNHFARSIAISGENGVPCPLPIPSYAKRILTALCKDIPFQVVCTSCHCELRTHVEVTAHFRTLCRKAGPVSVSDKSIADVASVFRIKAFCLTCKQGLSDEARIAKHITKTSHSVKQIISIEESILVFCYLNEGTKTPSDFCLLASNARLEHCMLKRNLNNTGDSNVLSKDVQQNETDCGLKKEANIMVTVWFCECSRQFSAEKDAEKHIMVANKISHKCMVCGKLADDAAIIRLHMCRFHGGARLDSFLFWCQMCKVELARTENVLMHIIDCHGGHSFYYEQEVPEEQPTSLESDIRSESPASNASPLPQPSEGLWQCHICEETFDNEETVLQHCQSLSIHQFHKYCCETCRKTFLKMDTLLRHFQLQHDGDIKMKYFCGLCKDLYFDEEVAFLGHYESFHALDYSYVPNQGQSDIKIPDVTPTTCSEPEKRLTCGCLEKYSVKARKKADGKLCLDKLFGKGNLWYSCSLCPATHQTFEGINTHVCKKEGQSNDRNFVIKCSICSKSFSDPEGAQSHYHVKHCFLKDTYQNYNFKTDELIGGVFTFTASGSSVSKPPARLKHTKELHHKAETVVKIQPETELKEIQNRDTEPQDCELPDLDFLKTMTHIVFIDLDNWALFFSHLPGYLNEGTFVWGFQGGMGKWKPPKDCKFFRHVSNTGCFFLHPCCSNRKDAADFAICMHAGRLDERLPKQIPFSVLSGDKGFVELENQFKKTHRSVHILNPHHVEGDMMCALLNSISENTQDTRDEDMDINSMGQDEDAAMKEAMRRSLVEM